MARCRPLDAPANKLPMLALSSSTKPLPSPSPPSTSAANKTSCKRREATVCCFTNDTSCRGAPSVCAEDEIGNDDTAPPAAVAAAAATTKSAVGDMKKRTNNMGTYCKCTQFGPGISSGIVGGRTLLQQPRRAAQCGCRRQTLHLPVRRPLVFGVWWGCACYTCN